MHNANAPDTRPGCSFIAVSKTVRKNGENLMWKWCGAHHGLYYLIAHDDGRKIYLALDDYSTELIKILNAYERIDDPVLDGTGLGHPAFQRGEDHGVEMTCRALERFLDANNTEKPCFGFDRLNKLAQRIMDLKTT